MNGCREIIKVGIADMNIVRPPDIIRTSGLGSCVGVVLYDHTKEIAGLAHIMLPESSLGKAGKLNTAKYADTAIKELVDKLIKNGANQLSLRAKIAGGSQMFQFTASNDIMRIGARNIEAVKKQLAILNIPIVAEDIGGNSGRTIEFNPKTYKLMIRTVNKGVQEI